MNLASLETKWTTTEYFKVNPIEENIVENTVTGDLSKFSSKSKKKICLETFWCIQLNLKYFFRFMYKCKRKFK